MAKILIVAEHDGSVLNPSTSKCVSCATAIDGAEIDIVVLAADTAGIAAQAAEIASVGRQSQVTIPTYLARQLPSART
jgi:electron transfer flavoprotein alpha subunit